MKNRSLFILLFFLVSGINAYAQPCAHNFTGLIPIADLATNSFQGFTGGKYPSGSNAIPLEHFELGMQRSRLITPLDSMGHADTVSGNIGFLVLGYSTAAMTGRFFKTLSTVQQIDPKIKIIIGAQGGRDINSMTSPLSDYWTHIDSVLSEEHLNAQQIQVIWLSSGDIYTGQEAFPQQCQLQIEKYRQMLNAVKEKYPNIRIVFISDRPYAGYIGGPGEGPQELKEPTAYYNSWTVKWLIEKQINSEKNYSLYEIPFIDWGPPLWTDGTKGNKQGYTWDCDDAGKGGIHASSKGRMKEAALLFRFFSTHPYTKDFFRVNPYSVSEVH